MNKILCLIDTLGFGGGAERQMAGLAGLLHRRGYNVTLATYHRHKFDDTLYGRYGIRSDYIESNSNSVSKFLAVRSFIKRGKYDIVIAYKDGATTIACLCKLSGLQFKLIVSERNTTQKLSKREKFKFFLYRFADSIVPNSYSQGTYIKKHFPNFTSKVNVITNFTDTNLFSPNNEYKCNSDCTKLLVVARINPQKNIERFMEAVKVLKNRNVPVTIDWYGGIYVGADSYGKKINNLYEEAGIKDMLHFKGDTSKISEVYRQYDVFCLPSLYEGFPNVVCEAMSSGKPILCSNVCDNPHIVQDSINGFLFDPLNVDDIAFSIERYCMLGSDVKQIMGRKSREIAVTLLSEESFIQKYESLIQKYDTFPE